MTNKEVLSLNIMGKSISIACPPEDKPGLEAAAELLNNDIESIPDKSIHPSNAELFICVIPCGITTVVTDLSILTKPIFVISEAKLLPNEVIVSGTTIS